MKYIDYIAYKSKNSANRLMTALTMLTDIADYEGISPYTVLYRNKETDSFPYLEREMLVSPDFAMKAYLIILAPDEDSEPIRKITTAPENMSWLDALPIITPELDSLYPERSMITVMEVATLPRDPIGAEAMFNSLKAQYNAWSERDR